MSVERKKDFRTGLQRLLAPLFAKESRLEVLGSRELTVEGCGGVVSYSDTQIRLSIGRQAMLISGCELSISNMFGQTVCVSGRISSIEYI